MDGNVRGSLEGLPLLLGKFNHESPPWPHHIL
jgi:hypothetical protein